MPFTDKNGKQWPDTQVIDGVKLILDPVASVAAKRPKYRPDPAQQKEYAYNHGFAERPKEPASALEGLGMVGAQAATGILGQQLGGSLGGSLAGKTAEETAKTGLSEVGQQVLQNQTGQQAGQSLANLPSSGGSPIPVGTDASGGTLMSDGSIVPPSEGGSFFTTPGSESTLGSLASAAAVAKGGYDTYKSMQSGQGGKGLQAGLGQIGAGIGGYTFGPVGAVVGAGMGSTLGYGIKNRDTVKGNLALLATNPLALGVNLVGKALGYDPLGAMTHESTRFKTAQNTQKLLEASDDPTYQAYVQGMREQFKEAPKGNAYKGGQFATFDEYKKAGLDPTDLTGVYGNIKAYGPQWANMTEDQRIAVTQLNINDGLYDSEKGDVILTNEEKAKQNLYKIIAGETKKNITPAQQSLANVAIQRPVVDNKNSQWR